MNIINDPYSFYYVASSRHLNLNQLLSDSFSFDENELPKSRKLRHFRFFKSRVIFYPKNLKNLVNSAVERIKTQG